MIRLIGSDIDGTLVSEGSHEIDPRYFEVIHELGEYGIVFCACSGRQYGSMRNLFSPVADEIFFIASSGTMIQKENEILHSWGIEPSVYLSLIRELRKIKDAVVSVTLPDVTLIETGEDSPFMHLLRDEYHYVVRNVEDLTDIPMNQILEVSINSSRVDEIVDQLRKKPAFSPLSMTVSGAKWCDVVTKEAGKGEAFALLQEYLEIRKEETVYFGDNLNDLSAFQEAGISATVEDARHEVQEVVDLVEPSFMTGGVLQELHNILKHRKDYLAAGR